MESYWYTSGSFLLGRRDARVLIDPRNRKKKENEEKASKKIPSAQQFFILSILWLFQTMGDDVDAPYEMGAITSQTDKYHQLHFVNPYSLYDKPPPPVHITFAIGGVFVCIMAVLWAARFRKMKNAIPLDRMTYWMSVRAMISAAIDNDDPAYTIIKITAQSVMFLGGIQLDYHTAFFVMVLFFTFESSLDTLRTLLVVYEHSSTKDLITTSARTMAEIDFESKVTQLHPTNVYEDLSRVRYVVFMVFVTQTLLISFVVSVVDILPWCHAGDLILTSALFLVLLSFSLSLMQVVDILNSSTHACPDGTSGCPVAGTLGSWLFYCLGIFMAGVVLLGPKTNFGESEQNPAFWIQLFMFIKAQHQNGSRVEWTDAKTGNKKSLVLYKNDWRVWARFLMSFIINGIGFHILVFALPIQIAAQSSLTGVVFRAVGMLYLVDLDDSPGYTLTLVENESTEDREPDESTRLVQGESPLQKEAKAIIQEARDKLDALASSSGL